MATKTYTKWERTVAIGSFVLLEAALLFLAYTDFHMTEAGLIRHGTNPDKAFQLAAAIGVFMFLLWSVILNLARINTIKGFLQMVPVMVLLMLGTYAGAGQWIAVELAGTAATREGSTMLRRDVAAYLAPADRPAQTLTTISKQMELIDTRFADLQQKEKSGAFTGQPGEGPATRAIARVREQLATSRTGISELAARWNTTVAGVDSTLTSLAQRVETETPNRAEVEEALQKAIRTLGNFPFRDAEHLVGSSLTAMNGMNFSIPAFRTREGAARYQEFYDELRARIAETDVQLKGLLAQLKQHQLGPQPKLEVKPVRDVLWGNPWHYMPDITHSMVLTWAPFLYAMGPAQVVKGVLDGFTSSPSAPANQPEQPKTPLRTRLRRGWGYVKRRSRSWWSVFKAKTAELRARQAEERAKAREEAADRKAAKATPTPKIVETVTVQPPTTATTDNADGSQTTATTTGITVERTVEHPATAAAPAPLTDETMELSQRLFETQGEILTPDQLYEIMMILQRDGEVPDYLWKIIVPLHGEVYDGHRTITRGGLMVLHKEFAKYLRQVLRNELLRKA